MLARNLYFLFFLTSDSVQVRSVSSIDPYYDRSVFSLQASTTVTEMIKSELEIPFPIIA